jgi:hypothetical protein
MSKPVLSVGGLNSWNGFVEDTHINPVTFDQEFHNFNTHGFATDPSTETGGSAIIGQLKPRGSKLLC